MFKKLTSKLPIHKDKEPPPPIITPEDSGAMRGGFVIGLGNNSENQLTQKVPRPSYDTFVSIPSSFPVDISHISLGSDHVVYTAKDSSIYVTGSNKNGALGSLSMSKAEKLTQVQQPALKLKRAQAYQYHTVFWNDKGNLLICGKGGLLGFPTDEQKGTPALIPALKDLDIVEYSSGSKHSYAVDSNGNVHGWGKSDLLGIGSFTKVKKITTHTREPILIECSAFINFRVLKIACGEEHTLALLENGTVWGWGRGEEMQLGHGVKETRVSPILIEALKPFDIVHISAGSYNSALITTKKECYVWGQFGNVTVPKPDLLGKALRSPIKLVDQIHQNGMYNIVLTPEREVYTFGTHLQVTSQDDWFPKLHTIHDPLLMYKQITEVQASASGFFMMVYEGTPVDYSEKVKSINYANKDQKTSKGLGPLPQSNYSKNMASLLAKPASSTKSTTTTTTSSSSHDHSYDNNL